ncbi:glycosyltransferase family 2 protein [Alteromonas sp. A079]|uniref:glycosyltransferase family 2 protein n=1 Tax=Alteromonas sp. A079 TaxID=3410268 RepID=UPI003B9DD383
MAIRSCDKAPSMLPTVSVIIAAYNAQNTIAIAIESALVQERCKIEVIVVDDCSTDETFAIASSYVNKDESVKVLRTPQNAGPSTARNIAIKAACSEWLAVLDADDYFAPDRLAALLTVAAREGADMVVDSYEICHTQGQSSGISRFTNLCAPNGVLPIKAADFIKLGLGSTKPVFKRSLLCDTTLLFNETVNSGEDLLLYAQILLRNPTCQFSNQPKYFRTEHSESLSRRDRVAFLQELIGIFELLKVNVLCAAHPDNDILNAITFRKKVNEDALVAARWRLFLANRKLPDFCTVVSLHKLIRHIWCKKMRFAYSERC